MPQQHEMRAPPFKLLRAADIEAKSGDVLLQFLTADDRAYRVRIDGALLPVLIATLIGLAPRSLAREPLASGQEVDLQMLTLTGFRKMFHPEGTPAIMLQFDGALEFGVVIPQNTLAALRTELAQLDALGKPKDPGTPQH